MQTEQNTKNYIETAKLYKKLVTSTKVMERLSTKELVDFIEKYEGNFYPLYTIDHVLESEIKESDFQKDFIELMKHAYGDHAEKILLERPNLTLYNISNLIVFEPCFVETFGENFVNQLLNFNYKESINADFNYLLQDMVENPESLNGFKFCYDFISKQNPDEIYNYTRAFRAYSEFKTLFNDCAKHNVEMTEDLNSNLLDLIVIGTNKFDIDSFETLKDYPQISKQYYDYIIERAQYFDDRKKCVDAILNRFFGLRSANTSKFESFRRSVSSIEAINKYYNLPKMIAYEENIREIDNKDSHFTKNELNLLKLINTISKISSSANIGIKDLVDLYNLLDKNFQSVVRPGDCRTIIEKIPNVCRKELTNTLLTVKECEESVLNNENGIRKEIIQRYDSKGNLIEIPVYHLEGKPFYSLMTMTDSNLSISREDVAERQTKTKSWFEYENGISHISCSYISESVRTSLEFYDSYKDQVNYMMGKDVNIISMGPDDIFSSSDLKDADSYSNRLSTEFNIPDELLKQSFRDNRYGYNEVTIERYSMQEEKAATKILPEALIKKGTDPSEEIIKHAIEFSEYVRDHEIRDKNFVLPIIMVDVVKYFKNTDMDSIKENLITKSNELNYMAMKYNNLHIDSIEDLNELEINESDEESKESNPNMDSNIENSSFDNDENIDIVD